MSADADLTSLIEPIARRLLGEPNPHLSSRTELRFGTHGSVAVVIAGPKRGTWFDHEAGQGGGALDLVCIRKQFQNGEALDWLRAQGLLPPRPTSKGGQIVTAYDYHAADGTLLFQVVRLVPKDFRQRRPDGNGGWVWDMHGVDRVPYRLPELLRAAADAKIYTCEGEKDCDALHERGLIATTNPGGAGKWQPSMSAHLRDRDVVILPDNDPAGEQHAQGVARKLHGIARSIRVLRLPGLPDKGDVSDWLAAGGTADEMERLAAEASPAPEHADSVAQLMSEFNSRYFVINEAGRAVIYAPKFDPILNRRFFERMTFDDLERLYSNRFISVIDATGQPVSKPAAKVWLSHADRKQFIGGMVFDPSNREQAPDVLNLWHGFAVEPRNGTWEKLQRHVLEVICRSENALFAYVLDWMADLVQHPDKQGEVAIVLRGPEGCGKGVLARAIKYLFGPHALAISNTKHLTGNFNGHLRDTVFLFADEAFYAGDKQHVGVLKALITEPYLTIEAKYQNPVQMPNFLHIMMASNEDWVVPASLDSRRWLVIDVPGTKAGDHAYFAAIQAELEHGGYEAMLYDLLARDLSQSNLRAVPVTDALQTQRKMSLSTEHAWWNDCLHRGYVYRSHLGLEGYFGGWHDFLPTEILFESYRQYCREHHERRPLSRELLGRFMVSIGAKPARRRNQAVGEHMVDGRSGRVAELLMHRNPRGYKLGALRTARKAFSSASGLSVDWEGKSCSG
jgi:hypothetical protein